MGKGNKYRSWFKDGIKTSRKWYKKLWNRKVRHSNNIQSGSSYKKVAGESMFNGIV